MSTAPSEPKALIQKRIRVRIDKHHVSEPVICELIRQFQLTINIRGALLAPNAQEDGWFDLELTGTTTQIDEALRYLRHLNLEVISPGDVEGW